MSSCSDPSGSAEEPEFDQTSGLVSPAPAAALRGRRRYHGNTALLPSAASIELQPLHVSDSAPPPGAAAPGPRTYLSDTHAGSVFPLLTQISSELRLKTDLKTETPHRDWRIPIVIARALSPLEPLIIGPEMFPQLLQFLLQFVFPPQPQWLISTRLISLLTCEKVLAVFSVHVLQVTHAQQSLNFFIQYAHDSSCSSNLMCHHSHHQRFCLCLFTVTGSTALWPDVNSEWEIIRMNERMKGRIQAEQVVAPNCELVVALQLSDFVLMVSTPAASTSDSAAFVLAVHLV